MIYRIGGPTITTVATSTVGARAVRILSRGKTLGQVKKILSSELGIKTENLDLQPVVDAMVKARIVRRVDGRQVEAGGPRAAQVLGQAFQFAYQLATEWARSSAIRYLPPKLSHMALFWAARKRSPAMPSPLVLTNLERALGSTLPPQALEAIALRHASEQLSRNIDSHLLRNLPPATMVRWLRDSTVVSGMEPLLELRKQGRGAILCGFHFGAPTPFCRTSTGRNPRSGPARHARPRPRLRVPKFVFRAICSPISSARTSSLRWTCFSR